MALLFPIYKNRYPYACTLRSLRGLTHDDYQPNHKIIGFDGPGGNVAIIPISANVNDPYKYKFGGKEYQEEFDVNMYVPIAIGIGARNYDPALGRWMNVDPLADHPKQIDVSPYAYTANNPIRYIDPTGMIWEDENKVEELKESIRKRQEKQKKDIDRIQTKIDNKNLSEKAIARKQKRIDNKTERIDEMNKSIEDIDFLGESEFTFRLADGGDLNHVTQGEDGVINIQGSNDAIHIHEIRHVSLSLNSEEGMRFSNGYLTATKGIGLYDEMEGYKAQYAFRPGSLPFSVKNLKDFNYTNPVNQVRMTKKIGSLKQNGQPIYKQINLLHLQHKESGFYKKYGL